MRPTRKLRGALALVVGLSLAAAACSDGGDDSATSDEPAPVESPAPDVAGDTPGATDPATICDPAGLVEAVESGPDQGTLAGMTDDPVATAASSNPVLTTLVTAVTEADLVDTLNSADAVTVFAQTDCAFAALDPATGSTWWRASGCRPRTWRTSVTSRPSRVRSCRSSPMATRSPSAAGRRESSCPTSRPPTPRST